MSLSIWYDVFLFVGRAPTVTINTLVFFGFFYLLLFYASFSIKLFSFFLNMLSWIHHLRWSYSLFVCCCGWFCNVSMALRGETYTSLLFFVTFFMSTIISVTTHFPLMNCNGVLMLAVAHVIPWFDFYVYQFSSCLKLPNAFLNSPCCV